MAGFAGFSKGMGAFFRGLYRNNNRDWFNAHKADYEQHVKAPMLDFVEGLNAELAEHGPLYVTEPKRAIYRIYRDTRFSKDKTPYKDHVGAIFTPKGAPRHAGAGLYCGISHKTVEVAAGVYMPEPEQLLQIRGLLAERHAEFRRMTGARSYKTLMGELHGEQLQRVPRGFAADHPAQDLLRRKAWYFYVKLDPALATSPRLFGEMRRRFLASLPLLDFLNEPVLAAARRKERASRLLE